MAKIPDVVEAELTPEGDGSGGATVTVEVPAAES